MAHSGVLGLLVGKRPSRLRQIARRVGIDIARYHPQRRRYSLEEGFEQLRRAGLEPRTVIDVGVARGTPEMYRHFPDAELYLVEPLEEWEPDLQRIVEERSGTYDLVAASSSPGALTIRVPEGHSHASLLKKDNSGGDRYWVERCIPAERLDDLLARRKLAGPYLLKIDVEGAELDVLHGAADVLNNTEAIVLEVTLFEVFEGGASFADLVAFLSASGFVIYDFVGGFCRSGDLALYQIDVIFVSRESSLRARST